MCHINSETLTLLRALEGRQPLALVPWACELRVKLRARGLSFAIFKIKKRGNIAFKNSEEGKFGLERTSKSDTELGF